MMLCLRVLKNEPFAKSFSFPNWLGVDEMDVDVSAKGNGFLFPSDLKMMISLAIFIPPAVENAVPPINMMTINTTLPPTDKWDKSIN